MKLQNTVAAVAQAHSKFVTMHATGKSTQSGKSVYGTVVNVRLGIIGTVWIDIAQGGHVYVCDSETVELIGNP